MDTGVKKKVFFQAGGPVLKEKTMKLGDFKIFWVSFIVSDLIFFSITN